MKLLSPPSLLVLFMLYCFCALTSCRNSTPTQRVTQNSPHAQTIEQQICDEVSKYRVGKGLTPLTRHSGLDQLARDHCHYLAAHKGSFSIYGKNVSHFGALDRSTKAAIRYDMPETGENVAAIASKPNNPALHILLRWIASKPHHQTIRADWTHTGVGVVIDDDGMIFATQLFGKTAD